MLILEMQYLSQVGKIDLYAEKKTKTKFWMLTLQKMAMQCQGHNLLVQGQIQHH